MSAWLLIIMICFSICWMTYYIYGGHKNPYKRCCLKTISSACFVLIGALSIQFHTSSIYGFMMIGFVLGMLGDVLLDLAACYPHVKKWYFLAGLSSFLLGHIAYTIGFYIEGKWYWEIIFCIFISVICIQCLQRVSCNFDEVKLPVYLYGTVILCMLLQSVKNVWFQPSLYTVLLCAGASLFTISDLVLAFLLFQDRYHRPSMTWVNLTTYYMAQMIFALSLYIA